MNEIAKKKTALVVCPGRGSYGRNELGYLGKNAGHIKDFLAQADQFRQSRKQRSVMELDSLENFSVADHLPGENAAALIYSSSYADYLSIDQTKVEVVAITGNSMGWYTALGASSALPGIAGFEVANTMGSMMQDEIIGGQLVYPLINDQWQVDPHLVSHLDKALQEVNQDHEAYYSIRFGGYAVIGADDQALKKLMKMLPRVNDQFPMKMAGHAAFHTPLLMHTSELAMQKLNKKLFQAPQVPLIDGRGHIWQPTSTNLDELYSYTLGNQVTQMYDFSAAITVGLKEFAPDVIVILGPGDATGGAVAQIMIQNQWQNCQSKEDFLALQKSEPFVWSMGRAEQRKLIV